MIVQDFVRLIEDFLADAMDVRSFCVAYEESYNFKYDGCRSGPAYEELRNLLNIVAYFSPYADELASVPNYRSESQVREAAVNAVQALRQLEQEPGRS